MIKVENLNKSFGDSHILHDISTEFKSGMKNLVIGKSGSGKTVLLKCLIGLFRPETGSIYYDDRDFLALSDKEVKYLRTELGMLFQANALFDSMTVKQNVMFPLRMFSDMSKKDQEERADFCIGRVGLSEASGRLPAEISGGMQKRAAIARAISLNPKYLFCDEPNSGLDPHTAVVIDKLIAEITDEFNITTVINTHDMNSVLEHGDHITFINQGYLEWTGNKDEFLTSDNKVLNDFIYSTEVLRRIKK